MTLEIRRQPLSLQEQNSVVPHCQEPTPRDKQDRCLAISPFAQVSPGQADRLEQGGEQRSEIKGFSDPLCAPLLGPIRLR
jgi:hypothetical protein